MKYILTAVMAVVFVQPLRAAVTLVQSTSVEGAHAGSLAAAFPNSNTPGNLIIVFVRMDTMGQTVSISDSGGNVYQHAISQTQHLDSHQIHIFYAKNIVAGLNTAHATFSSTNSHSWMAIYEYSGLDTANPLDQVAHAQGSGLSPFTGLITTTTANELEFSGGGLPDSFPGTIAPGYGYAMAQQNTGIARAANEAAVLSTAGQYAGRFYLNARANWSAVVATFKPAGATTNGPSIVTGLLPSAIQNNPYQAPLNANGGTPPYKWSITGGTLPAGLVLDSNSGVIAGTPSATGFNAFTVEVMDANARTATQQLDIQVNPPLAITTTSLPGGTQNAHYDGLIFATGGQTPYLGWSIVSGQLPPGLAITSYNAKGGEILGTPSQAGAFGFTVQVTDTNGQTATTQLSITIAP
jgi:hypothetical protein